MKKTELEAQNGLSPTVHVIESISRLNIFYTTLDCVNVFFPIPLAAEDNDQLTFMCHDYGYTFAVIPQVTTGYLQG